MTTLADKARAAMEGATEGPWRVEYKCGQTRLIAGGECTMCDEPYYPWVPENPSDWDLFALAPDLARAVIAAEALANSVDDIILWLQNDLGADIPGDLLERLAGYRKATEIEQ